jgi:hypothetical protein
MDSALITKTDIINDHIVIYAGRYVQRSIVDSGFIYSGGSFYLLFKSVHGSCSGSDPKETKNIFNCSYYKDGARHKLFFEKVKN